VRIDTPLWIVGHGPAALVVAKLASGRGVSSLLLAGPVSDDERPVLLGDEAVAALRPDGVFDVLRPYLVSSAPVAMTPAAFEEVLKHHCVVDMGVTVYDGMSVVELERGARGAVGAFTDGRGRWDVVADAFVDAAELPSELDAAVRAGAAVVEEVLAALR
jgi:hypothetical protein